MTIKLHDIHAAVEDYLSSSVTTLVNGIRPASGGTMNPNEEGKFDILVTNVDDPNGVPLVNARFHLTFKKDANGNDIGALFKVPDPTTKALTAVRENSSETSALLTPGTLVTSMVLFPNNGTLVVGGSFEAIDLVVRTPSGKFNYDVTVQCHAHAEADPDFLFPPNDPTKNGSITFTVS